MYPQQFGFKPNQGYFPLTNGEYRWKGLLNKEVIPYGYGIITYSATKNCVYEGEILKGCITGREFYIEKMDLKYTRDHLSNVYMMDLENYMMS